MKYSNRTIALMMSILMVAVLFSACGAAINEPATTTVVTEASTTTAVPTLDMTRKIKISMATTSTHSTPNDAKYVKIMEDKYNIDLDIWECYGENYVTQVNAKIAGGEIPDVVKMSGGLPVADYVKQGLIIPIEEDFLKTNMPKYYADLYALSPTPFKYCKVDGKIYGIPGTSADGIYHFTCIFRSDWLANVGITKVPETLAEYEAAFYAFTNDDPDKNGKNDTYGLSNLGLIPVMGAFGCIPYNNSPQNLAEYSTVKDGKVVHAASQPEMKEALKLLNKLYKDGVIDPEFATGERKEGHWSASQAFSTGRIGFTSCGQYYNTGRMDEMGRDGRVFKLFKDTQTALGITSSDYVHAKPPIGPTGKSGGIKWGVEQGIAFAFGKPMENDIEKQTRVAMWFDDMWMVQDNYMSLIYGIKGVDWNQDADGTMHIGLSADTKLAFENDETDKIGLGFMFIPDIASAMKKETPKYYAFADKVANFTSDYVDPVSGAPIADALTYKEDLNKLTLSAYYDMITGKQPIDTYFDQYVKDWDAAGGTVVMQQYQDFYDKNIK